MHHKLIFAAFGLILAASVRAETPVLPDQWLSESLEPGSVVLSTKHPVYGAARGLATEVIAVTPLDDVKLDAVGVLPANVAGLPVDFWGDSNSAILSRLLRSHDESALPEVTALFHRILLAELDVPIGHDQDGKMLLARLDHLLAAGALDQAEALLDRSGIANAELFRRWFDVGLLTGRAQEACAAMLGDPGLTPALQARVFCLSRSGDWSAAALTLTTAAALNKINATDVQLLSRFLDPDLFEGQPVPPVPARLSPLVFTMREALALPRSGQSLPLAFLYGDLENFGGWRNRLAAVERLVRAQSVPVTVLLEVYSEGRPSASGGVWERVGAVQKLSAALESGDNAAAANSLIAAYQTLSEVHLEFALAELILPQISDLPLTGEAATIRFFLSLLQKSDAELAAQFADITQHDAFLIGVSGGDFATIQPSDDLQSAILSAFRGTPVETQLLRDAKQGRIGEAILKSFALLQQSGRSDPVAVETVLSVLLQAGLSSEARRIAVQLVILNRQAAI